MSDPTTGIRPVVGVDGAVDPEFTVCNYVTPLGVKIQCIVAAKVDVKYLLVVPQQVWHRLTARRVVPPGVLAKPTLVDLTCTNEEDRSVLVEDVYLRVWVGYVTEETYSSLEVLELGESVDYGFKVDGVDGYLPSGNGVAEALREHFAFLSADSGEGGEPTGAIPPSEDLRERVNNLEQLMQGVAENANVLVSSHPSSSKVAKSSSRRVTFGAAPTTIEDTTLSRSSRFQGLDPGVVAAALSAGVSEENLTEMQRLLAVDPAGAKRLREPALRRT
eukprot:s3668_g7.t2